MIILAVRQLFCNRLIFLFFVTAFIGSVVFLALNGLVGIFIIILTIGQ